MSQYLFLLAKVKTCKVAPRPATFSTVAIPIPSCEGQDTANVVTFDFFGYVSRNTYSFLRRSRQKTRSTTQIRLLSRNTYSFLRRSRLLMISGTNFIFFKASQYLFLLAKVKTKFFQCSTKSLNWSQYLFLLAKVKTFTYPFICSPYFYSRNTYSFLRRSRPSTGGDSWCVI